MCHCHQTVAAAHALPPPLLPLWPPPAPPPLLLLLLLLSRKPLSIIACRSLFLLAAMDQPLELDVFELWKTPLEMTACSSCSPWASLADVLLRLLIWLPWECAKHARSPSKTLVIRLNGSSTEFEKLYSIGEKIGQGGFGKVFACKDLHSKTEETLCVKVVPVQGRHTARLVKVCEREKSDMLSKCLRIDHPNIVKYHRFIQTDDALYTVMGRCCGLDLVDHVKEQGDHLPIDRIRLLAQHILAAVATVHGLDIMHRDIKPENFRFKDTTAQVLQLLDFGFAKPAQDFPAEHSITGTLLYAAPEVFDGHYCRKCDLWSTGIVFFQLFTGHPPFQTGDVQILRSLHRDPVLIGDGLFRGEAQRQVPRGARDLIRGLLAVEPSERLCAQIACEHEWLQQDTTSEEEEEDKGPRRKSTLKRDSSQISMHGGDESAGIKRSYFVWDLAGSASSDGEEITTDPVAEGATHP
mmetsp:Transcript_89329/g.288809  ORF Transcript_89329/g.288809 Transcript_89329/m.288809 type:complete len:466 (-) Transcript_89329:156-1553(-)